MTTPPASDRTRHLTTAMAIGLIATLLALAARAVGGANLTALEWNLYDHWLRDGRSLRGPSQVVVVVRDEASQARFGRGPWDRAVLARVITHVARAGAVSIGLDVSPGQPSPPGRGGAASDVLLSQAIAQAGMVVTAVPPRRADIPTLALTASPGLPPAAGGLLRGVTPPATDVGHALAPPDDDGVVRRVPLLVQVDDRAVPALGLALAASYIRTRGGPVAGQPHAVVPSDGRGQMLVSYGPAGHQPLTVIPFHDVWTAIEEGHAATLRALVDGKVLLVLAEPAAALYRTPVGDMPAMVIQAHLLDTVIGSRWSREAPTAWTLAGTALLAGVGAWLLLAMPGWRGFVGVGVLAVGYAACAALALLVARLVLPVTVPLSAIIAAAGGALLWIQFALEEDLESARLVVARTAGIERELGRASEALRSQLAEARAQEDQTRCRIEALERELHGLRPAEGAAAEMGDAEQEPWRRECEQMGILTRDVAVLGVFRDLKKAARSSLPILLVGEPGTGKELFARAAHRLSSRAGHPFVAVNMAAISPELFESELFGHVKGSFTGAVGDRKGYFELADRGTIFLDEVGDLRLEQQSKLLRVLQEKSFYRVGATRPSAVDVRVVAASNRELDHGVAEGWFREDLYFRLKGLVLRLPPLRERREDLPLLATRFMAEAAAELGRNGLMLSEEALHALQHHDWAGNVRELQHCLRQAVALAEGRILTRPDLRLPAAERAIALRPLDTGTDPHSDTAVVACLRQHRFDMQATARALGWDRSTVTQRLKGVGFRALLESGGDRAKAALALAGSPGLARSVELRLREYHEHLEHAIREFDSLEAAVGACRRRFKNLPDRHFRAVEELIRRHFEPRSP